jgi:hypothetical protein
VPNILEDVSMIQKRLKGDEDTSTSAVTLKADNNGITCIVPKEEADRDNEALHHRWEVAMGSKFTIVVSPQHHRHMPPPPPPYSNYKGNYPIS